MAIKTFRQYALGFGTVTATITAKIDGVVVFSGEVLTHNEVKPTLPDYEYDMNNVAYSWTGDSTHQGTSLIEVTVNSGLLLLANIEANNPLIDTEAFGRFDVVSTGPGDEDYIDYPYVSDEKINGNTIPAQQVPKRLGQAWNWIGAGNTWTANLYVVESILPPPDTESPTDDPS